MPETKERDPKHSFVDYIEFLKETAADIFGVPVFYFDIQQPTKSYKRYKQEYIKQVKNLIVDAPKREAVEDVLRHQYGYEVINGLKIHDYDEQ